MLINVDYYKLGAPMNNLGNLTIVIPGSSDARSAGCSLGTAATCGVTKRPTTSIDSSTATSYAMSRALERQIWTGMSRRYTVNVSTERSQHRRRTVQQQQKRDR
jgi:hypothetical protein